MHKSFIKLLFYAICDELYNSRSVHFASPARLQICNSTTTFTPVLYISFSFLPLTFSHSPSPFLHSISLSNHPPLFQRRHRTVAESGGGSQYTMSYYPKVVGSKLSTFHPSFPSNSYGNAFTLPKITGTSNTTSSYLPSLSQAFMKHAAKVKVSTKGTGSQCL